MNAFRRAPRAGRRFHGELRGATLLAVMLCARWEGAFIVTGPPIPSGLHRRIGITAGSTLFGRLALRTALGWADCALGTPSCNK